MENENIKKIIDELKKIIVTFDYDEFIKNYIINVFNTNPKYKMVDGEYIRIDNYNIEEEFHNVFLEYYGNTKEYNADAMCYNFLNDIYYDNGEDSCGIVLNNMLGLYLQDIIEEVILRYFTKGSKEYKYLFDKIAPIVLSYISNKTNDAIYISEFKKYVR